MNKKLNSPFTLTLLIISLLLSNISYSQNGQPFIKNFLPLQYNGSGQIWDIAQGPKGRMYFAGNDGLIIFDGIRWTKFSPKQFHGFTIRSIAFSPSDSVIYIGSVEKFGYLKPTPISFKFICLSDSLSSKYQKSFADIWSTKKLNNYVLFLADSVAFLYNIKTHKTSVLATDQNFTFISKLNNYLIFSSSNYIYKFNTLNASLQKISNPYRQIWFFYPYSGDTVLAINQTNIYLFDIKTGKNIDTNIFTNLSKTIGHSLIYSFAASYGSKPAYYIAGTVHNGIYIFSRKGKIIKHLNKKLGLVNQTVHCLYFDADSSLWAGTSNGISVLNLKIPFRIFDERNGIEGVIYSFLPVKNQLYLGTNLGLFFYNKQKDKFQQIYYNNAPIQQVFALYKIKLADSSVKYIACSAEGIFQIHGTKVKLLTSMPSYSLSYSPLKPDAVYFIYGSSLFKIPYKKHNFLQPVELKQLSSNLFLLNEADGYNIWLWDFAYGTLAYYNVLSDSLHYVKQKPNINALGLIDKNKYVFLTPSNLLKYDYKRDTFLTFNHPLTPLTHKYNITLIENIDSNFYAISVKKNKKEKIYLVKINNNHLQIDSLLFQIINNVSSFKTFDKDIWVISDKIYKFNPNNYSVKSKFPPVITQITINYDSVIYSNPLYPLHKIAHKFPYKFNSITFFYSLPSYFASQPPTFSYLLLGSRNEKWSPWSTEAKHEFLNLFEGKYILKIKARNQFHYQSQITSFEFKISPPWYRSIPAYIFYFLTLVAFIYIIVKLRERQLKKENERLEQIIKQRTAEIQQQKEEILAQAENLKEMNELLKQKNQEIEQILENLQQANKKISEQNKHITASIEYAKKIQTAIFAYEDLLDQFFPQHFIFFQPKEIVSGDFYWAEKIQNKIFIAVADCTGHSVPGAMMSMLSSALLSQIFTKKIHSTAQVLNQLRNEIIKILVHSEKSGHIYREGLDIALISIDTQTLNLEFSGAYNPVIIVRNNQLIELKPDKMPIGYSRKTKNFSSQTIKLLENDMIYMFSDGFQDQFGGPNYSKFYRKNFYKLLLSVANLPTDQQLQIITSTFFQWKNNYPQTDDVLVLGLRIISKYINKNTE